MSEQEWAQMFQEQLSQAISERNDEDYIVNPIQQEKLLKIVYQFSKLIEESGGRFADYKLVPRLKHGYVTAVFTAVCLNGESISDFCNALSEASAISIDAALGGVCISVTVPDVFDRKT